MSAATSGRDHRRGTRLGRLRPYCAGAGALVLLALLLAAGSCSWFALPSYDGSETVSGLDAPVEIVRDAHAIPHIYAQSPRDGAFAMGYVHAQDRLWQLEMQRRIGQARLAEVVGEPGLKTDRFLRTLGVYRVAERNVEALSPQAQAIYAAYAAGVNAYLETRSGLLPPEFLLLGHEPEPWRPADSLVWLKMMAWDLGDNFSDEMLRARLAGRLDAAQLQDLWAQHPDDPLPALDARSPALDTVDIDFAALAAAVPAQSGSGFGSNGWALSGAHTDSGKPLLANDPHLRLEVPSVWYLAHVSTPEFEIVGATLPGLPFPLLGRTENFAWGFTNTGPDVQDLFVERIDPDDPARYLAPEGSLPFAVRTETIGVSGGEAVELTVRETRHGPVVSGVVDESGEFLEAGHVLAFAWTALDDDDRTGEALVQAAAATDWVGFTDALRNLAVPQQTIVFADRDGNIGMIAPGRVPIRAAGHGHMPAPGWTGSHDWVGWVPHEALPRAYNPQSGRIVNANNRMVPLDYPHFLSDDWTPPYRAGRIEALLDATPRHDVESLAAIQQDLVSLAAERLLPVLLGLAEASDDDARSALAMLEAWDRRMGREQAEPLIYMAWLRELMHALFADELGACVRGLLEHPARGDPPRAHRAHPMVRRDDDPGGGELRPGRDPRVRGVARVPRRHLRPRPGGVALGRGPRRPHEEPHPGRGPRRGLLVRDRHGERRREGNGEGRRLRRERPGAPLRPEPRRRLPRRLRPRRARTLGLHHQHRPVRQPPLVALRGFRGTLARRPLPPHAHREGAGGGGRAGDAGAGAAVRVGDCSVTDKDCRLSLELPHLAVILSIVKVASTTPRALQGYLTPCLPPQSRPHKQILKAGGFAMASVNQKLPALRTVITENLRVQRSGGTHTLYRRIPSTQRYRRCQNHAIFARRGCGKTLLLQHSSKHLPDDIQSVYLNCEDFKHHTFPNVLIEILDAFDELQTNLSGWFGKKKKSSQLISEIRRSLQELQYQEDQQDAEVVEARSDQKKQSQRLPLVSKGSACLPIQVTP